VGGGGGGWVGGGGERGETCILRELRIFFLKNEQSVDAVAHNVFARYL